MADAYKVLYMPEATADIRGLRAFDARAVVSASDDHLGRDPTQESRSRIKRMEQPFWSQYRLRVGEFRVYYDIDEQARTVSVLRVLPKGTGPTPENQP